ncbi:ankyrin repeat and protein kinase domain-containing protein 1-like [Coccinella septempunctata]|uniref:ankyrin repeat and protein kinase domain-containing protein 1-like n=1 Tax=Coccinella septempunctata TaxID=41139 RepID=UPI001D06F156|nr:ankyrin repeat and protein kinase domain-containing protein 1-like [Coccinella septempunctata]XP_044759356.1 ankyrin repeat and protein kinase domain-containing protein 1-like [Coccinella septempunctata]
MLFLSVELFFILFLIVILCVNKKVLLLYARKKLKQNQDRINSAFRASIFAGEEHTMLKLLEEGADVKCTDVIGYACLHHAVLCGHYKLIKHLVMYGADIEKEGNFYGYKPIHLCVYPANKDKCLEELLKYGAQLDAVDCLQNTLLHLVVKFRPQDMNFIEKLLDYGLGPNATNIIGNNCLHIIAASRTCSIEKVLFLARKLIHRGVDIDRKNTSIGETPLQIASRTGKTVLVDLLLREGAAIDVRSNIGLTAFEQLFVENHPMTAIITTFIKHIALRKHRGENVEDSIFRKIASDVKLQIIYRYYDEDLEYLKSINIVETHWVTLHHILCCEKSEVINYLRNASVRNNIFSQEVSTFYWNEIRHKFSKIIKIVKFQEEACRVLNIVFDSGIPYLCLKQICKYLSEEDVKKLSTLLLRENTID